MEPTRTATQRSIFPAGAVAGASAGPVSLDGVLEYVSYANAESGWSVIKLNVEGKPDLVTAVGNIHGVQPGESLHLTGRWTQDRKWGEQFRIESFATVKPATVAGIEKYLGSGLVRGIGKVMAERLVQHFGLETLDVIEKTPQRLVEVEGIGRVRQASILAAWEEQSEIRRVMLFLQGNGVSASHAVRIFKQYKDQSIAVVTENPYRLALDVVLTSKSFFSREDSTRPIS
jgi:exodeoxyribonuclease V alpha subunit